MAKYKLCDFEENRYHDSYGYVVFFDDETNKIERRMTWTTVGGLTSDPFADLLYPTLEVVEKAVEVYTKKLLRIERRRLIRNHYSPGNTLLTGEEVVFKKAFNGKKQPKVAKGTVAEVLRVRLNQFKSRFNTEYFNVEVRLIDGTRIWVDTDKVSRVGRLKETRKQTYARCLREAYGCGFRDLYFGGWDDNNWAAQVLKKKAA